MAWEISITAEGWADIRTALDSWTSEALIEALADDTLEAKLAAGVDQETAETAATLRREQLARLPQDILADAAFELIQEHNTCDNGGWAYWIDREGFHKVVLD